MGAASFNVAWSRIVNHAGQTFYTIKKTGFTYRVDGGSVITDRTKYKIPKSDFDKAYKMMPIRAPGDIGDAVRGSSYVWAILNDPRI